MPDSEGVAFDKYVVLEHSGVSSLIFSKPKHILWSHMSTRTQFLERSEN